MSAFICEAPKPNEKSEVLRMLRVWDVDKDLVSACIEFINGSEDLQAEWQEIKKLQADREPSATRSQDFLRSMNIMNGIMRIIISGITSMHSDDTPALRAEGDVFKDPSLHMRLFTSYRDDYEGLFVLFDFASPQTSGPLSALPRASAKRALKLGAAHLSKRPSHDVSLGLVFVGKQFSVARIDRAGAAFSPMRKLKEKDGLEVLVRVVRSLKQGAQPDPNNLPTRVHKRELWELPKD